MAVTGPNIFKEAAGEALPSANTIWRIRQNIEDMGLLGGSVESVNLRGVALAKRYDDVVSAEKQKEREATSTTVFITLLDNLRNYRDWLADEIERGEEGMRERYGDDYINVFAETNLSPELLEEYHQLETDDERRAFLVEHMLKEDGSLAEGYEHLDPRDVEVLQRWQQLQKVEPKLDEFESRYAEEGMTEELMSDMRSFVNSVNDEQATEMLIQSDDPEIEAQIDRALTEELSDDIQGSLNSLDF